MWNKKQIHLHLQAVQELNQIKDEAFDLIRNNSDIWDYEIQQFIVKSFKKRGLVSDKYKPIVAFNENSAIPEYYPKKDKPKKLEDNTFVMIDLWARVNTFGAPFADMTWVGYYGGKIPAKIQKVFKTVIGARDSCLKFIKKNLKKGIIPSGKEINAVADNFIIKKGYGEYLKHNTGHCIGFYSAHGNKENLVKSNKNSLHLNLGYTIEPGIYIDGEFGVRSEIDFYIQNRNLRFSVSKQQQVQKIIAGEYVSNKLELIVTTDIQKKIIKL